MKTKTKTKTKEMEHVTVSLTLRGEDLALFKRHRDHYGGLVTDAGLVRQAFRLGCALLPGTAECQARSPVVATTSLLGADYAYCALQTISDVPSCFTLQELFDHEVDAGELDSLPHDVLCSIGAVEAVASINMMSPMDLVGILVANDYHPNYDSVGLAGGK